MTPTLDDTRDAIIEAAMRLYTAHGYFSTSMRDIAAEAGLSTGAIYHHFPGKEAIARESFQRTIQFLVAELTAALDTPGRGRERVYAVIQTLLRLAEEHRVIMEYALYIKHREIIPDGKPICSSEPFELLKRFMAYEMRRGTIRQQDLYIATVGLTAMPIRFMQLRWDGVIETPLTELTDPIFDAVWRSLEA